MESELRRRKLTSTDGLDNEITLGDSDGILLEDTICDENKCEKYDHSFACKDGFLSSDDDSFSDALSANVSSQGLNKFSADNARTSSPDHHNDQQTNSVDCETSSENVCNNDMTYGVLELTKVETNESAGQDSMQDSDRTTINGCVAPDLNFREVPETVQSRKKIQAIEDVLSKKTVNVQRLRKLAISEGGLINDNIRKRAWAKLIGIDYIPPLKPLTEEELAANGEYSQVVLDVNRSLKRFPPGIPYDQRVVLQDQLTRLIMRVIIKHPHLRYYQGYHDVAVTVLLVVGEEAAFPIMEKLSTGHLNECMAETMDKTSYLLNYIYPLLKRMHPKLYEYMERSSCGTLFCLPWYLTWFGHNLNHYTDVVRLYDYFMSTDKLLPLYLAAAIVVYRQEEIFSVECDMPYIHSLLSNIPDDLPFEKLLNDATDLYKRYPPNSIEREVKERVKRSQMQMRGYNDRRINQRTPLGNIMNIAPRVGRYGLFIATATLMVGLYAYIRTASAIDVDVLFPLR